MKELEIVNEIVVKQDIIIEKVTKHMLLNNVNEESQVIVHCSFTGTRLYNRIRIWKSTFLYSQSPSHISKLVLTENITHYPTWMNVEKGQTINFTLIFTGLPRLCKQFDLIENIPEPGGFMVKNIERTNSDIYTIVLP